MNRSTLPAFVRTSAPFTDSEKHNFATGPTWATTESQGTTAEGGLDTREFDLSRHDARAALMRFLSWAVVNGKAVTIRPKN